MAPPRQVRFAPSGDLRFPEITSKRHDARQAGQEGHCQGACIDVHPTHPVLAGCAGHLRAMGPASVVRAARPPLSSAIDVIGGRSSSPQTVRPPTLGSRWQLTSHAAARTVGRSRGDPVPSASRITRAHHARWRATCGACIFTHLRQRERDDQEATTSRPPLEASFDSQTAMHSISEMTITHPC
jgi:hypothetical protein